MALGVVARPHGVRGELRVHAFHPESPLLGSQDRVVLRGPDGDVREVTIERWRPGPGGALLARIEGVDDRESADALRGVELCIARALLPPADDDEWYDVDLVGLEARRPDGSRVGDVVEVLHYPSVDCLRVRSDDGDREVPMVDPWLVSVDVDAGTVIVSRIEEIDANVPRRRRRK